MLKIYRNKITGQYPVTKEMIAAIYPNVIFANDQDECGVFTLVVLADKPPFDKNTHGVRDVTGSQPLDVFTQTWEVYELPAEEVAARLGREKTVKWEAIKAQRDQLSNTGGYKVGDKWFHSDAKSKTQQLGLVIMGAAANNVPPWKTMDGTFVPMSQALAAQIFQAAATMDGELFAVAEQHRMAMELSERPDLYDFSEGWPETFFDQQPE